MTEPQYVQATLNWCNARRKEQGKKPLKKLPRGEREMPESCPCGTATGLLVYGKTWQLGKDSDEQSCPRSVFRFVKAFDRGRLPQYEVKS